MHIIITKILMGRNCNECPRSSTWEIAFPEEDGGTIQYCDEHFALAMPLMADIQGEEG